MWCVKCNRDLSQCICADKKERINALMESPHLAFRVCLKCGKHYALCKCDNPKWGIATAEAKENNGI